MLAERVHEMNRECEKLDEYLYMTILDVLEVDEEDVDSYPIDDIETDECDNSITLLGCSPSLDLTHKENAKLFYELGFDLIIVEYTDGRTKRFTKDGTC